MGRNGCNRFALSYVNRRTPGIRFAAMSPRNRFALIDSVLNTKDPANDVSRLWRGRVELGEEER